MTVPHTHTNGESNQASRLIALARKHYDLRMSQENVPVAIAKDGAKIALEIKGGRGGIRGAISRLYQEEYGQAPSRESMAIAVETLEAYAFDDCEPISVYMRFARYADGVVIDRGTSDGSAIYITPEGWTVVNESPGPLFHRTALNQILPEPSKKGDFSIYRSLINVSDEDWPYVLAWQISDALGIENVIPNCLGPSGSGKTFAAYLMCRLIDPSTIKPRAMPENRQDWFTALSGTRTIAFDNITTIKPWQSDSLCRAVTGDGMDRRSLYSDNGHSATVIENRSLILTGIAFDNEKEDLLNRSIRIRFTVPSPFIRKEALQEQFQECWSSALGAFCDLTSQVLYHLPNVPNPNVRMGDYAQILAVVDRILGTNAYARYCEMSSDVADEVIESNLVISRLREFMMERKDMVWEGTAKSLLEILNTGTIDALLDYTNRRPTREWPNNGPALAVILRRYTSVLEKVGIVATAPTKATGNKNLRIWHIERKES